MSLDIGIVGLPNAGKSTLFNALASRRLAETASRPFTTIDPHEAVIPVPDKDLEALSKLVKPEKTIQATVSFIDIAGLVKGAHKGEGLGNQFLAKIREVDLIVHVVRAFKDPSVAHQHLSHKPGSLEQIIGDIEVVNMELELGGIKGKPVIYVLNVDEKNIKSIDFITNKSFEKVIKNNPLIVVSAKLEEELMDLETDERKDYLNELGIESSGLERLIRKAYQLLGLISFYTIKGGKEVTVWSIKKGSTAIEAAEVVHTDFADKFIKAEVINVDLLLKMEGWKSAKEKGKVRLEGRDYKVEDKDIIEFKVGS